MAANLDDDVVVAVMEICLSFVVTAPPISKRFLWSLLVNDDDVVAVVLDVDDCRRKNIFVNFSLTFLLKLMKLI